MSSELNLFDIKLICNLVEYVIQKDHIDYRIGRNVIINLEIPDSVYQASIWIRHSLFVDILVLYLSSLPQLDVNAPAFDAFCYRSLICFRRKPYCHRRFVVYCTILSMISSWVYTETKIHASNEVVFTLLRAIRAFKREGVITDDFVHEMGLACANATEWAFVIGDSLICDLF